MEQQKRINTQNKRLIAIVAVVGFLLLVPFTAQRFTSEVNWNAFDFIVAGFLLLGTGLGCEFVMRNVRKFQHRLAICAVILAVLVLVWIELAVGVFGTPLAGS